MEKIKIGIFGFGQTGKLVLQEFIKDERFSLEWVVRSSDTCSGKYASRLFGYECDCGKIFPQHILSDNFFKENPVDMIVDFSSSSGVHYYKKAVKLGIKIISAISKYEPKDLELLYSFGKDTSVLYSPNITLGINVLMVASQVIQKIIPQADIEIVEEHFSKKKETSGTALKLAKALELDEKESVNSIRVGGTVGRHEVIFGIPNQIIRLSHESINRAAFGQGAIFAALFLKGQDKGIYSMENIISEMFAKNIPVY
jgi:4-hydroxy-tetrahydrodipicolinate reductase